MPLDEITKAAIDVGRRQADAILKVRRRKLRQRNRVLKAHPAPITLRIERVPPPGMPLVEPMRVTVMRTAGVLVAEGDSWFDYPMSDVLSELEQQYGYDVESVAHQSDPIEDMAYCDGQLEEFTRRLEKVGERGVPLKAVLLSGGGDDIAGDQFAMLLNNARSAIPGLNAGVVQGVVNQRVRTAYLAILSAVTQVCQKKLGRPLPILIHGYDYAVPDGRGFMGGWGPLPGPWLEPGFRAKGYKHLSRRIALMVELIDTFNSMLQGLASLPPFAHVHYIDLRNTLSHRMSNYRNWWANELHPTEQGFLRVAERFAAVLQRLPSRTRTVTA